MRKMTLSFELTFIYIIVLICALLINVFLYDYIYTKEYEKQILDASEQSLHSINVTLTSIISNISDFSVSFISNQNLQELIRENNVNYSLVNEQRIETLIFTLSLSTNNVASVSVFDLSGANYQYSHDPNISQSHNRKYWEMDWYNDVQEKNGAAVVVSWNDNEDYSFDDRSLSVVRQINDLTTFQEVGLISVDVNKKALYETIQSISDKHDSKVLFLFEDEREFMRVNWDESGSFEHIDISTDKSYITNLDGEDYAVSVSSNTVTGLKIIYISPAKNINNSLLKLKITTITTAIISMILLVMVSLTISRKIINPVHYLANSMSEIIEDGTFKKVNVKTGKNEIGTLKNIYNIMIVRIQELIRNSVKEEKQKRKSELLALQEQIKPHFLYNTFDTISSLALCNETESVYKMTTALSSYYRISLSKGELLIPFEDEMKIISNYIYILKMRYKKAFEVEYDIDDNAKRFNIPKLTLQPFVENSIYHGIRPLGEEGTIKISAKTVDDVLVVNIEDNGVGMDEEVLKNITSCENKNQKSFGVKSTIERIKLIFGDNGSVELKSKLHVGTIVTIKIPFKEDIE